MFNTVFARAAMSSVVALLLLAQPSVAQFANPEEQFAEALQQREAGARDRALQLAEASAAAGHIRAAVLAADMLETGYAGAPEPERAVEYYRLAATQGDVDALLRLGVMARDARGGLSPGQAGGFFQRAADGGANEARYELALLHLNPRSPEYSAERALSLLRVAAIEGFIPAQRDLGLELAQRAQTPSEFEEATLWLSRAADTGDGDAAYAAGLVLAERGELEAAADMYALAAEKGHMEAAADLGWLLYRGEVAASDRGEAAQWLRRSAISGDPVGRFRYAWALAEGRDGVIEQDVESAYRWLLLAEAAGVAELGAGGDAAKIKRWLEGELGEAAIARITAGPLFIDEG